MFKSYIQFPKAAATQSYYASDLAKRYGFPAVPAGAPTPYVAVISLGGGYQMKDVTAYLQTTGIKHLVDLVDVSVDAGNSPGSDADTENDLDIQTIIGAGQGKVGVYFLSAQNADASFAAAIAKAATLPGVAAISVSWGLAESGWAAQARSAMDAAMKSAWDKGIPTFCASGDGGSKDGETKHTADYPASSPYAVGVGGTTISGGKETAWNYGGGGPSAVYSRPAWQLHNQLTFRGVPDMAANADPQSGYKIVVNGQWGVVGGTSASAPLLATAAALIKANGGSLKDFLPKVYSDWKMGDILEGSNGDYQCSTGYDFCTGAGVPDAAWFASFTAAPVPTPTPAPPPQTPCEWWLQLTKMFNAFRHGFNSEASMLSDDERKALAATGIACSQVPWAKLLQQTQALCPQPAPQATGGLCAGLQNLGNLLPVLQTLGQILAACQQPTA